MSEVIKYQNWVSEEPLDIIRANECESDLGSLCTKRFRRLWNEIEDLRAKASPADVSDPNNARMSYMEAWALKMEEQADLMDRLEAERKKADPDDRDTFDTSSEVRMVLRERAKVLRDQVTFCRKLLGIEHTPIDTRSTMEIRNERN